MSRGMARMQWGLGCLLGLGIYYILATSNMSSTDILQSFTPKADVLDVTEEVVEEGEDEETFEDEKPDGKEEEDGKDEEQGKEEADTKEETDEDQIPEENEVNDDHQSDHQTDVPCFGPTIPPSLPAMEAQELKARIKKATKELL